MLTIVLGTFHSCLISTNKLLELEVDKTTGLENLSSTLSPSLSSDSRLVSRQTSFLRRAAALTLLAVSRELAGPLRPGHSQTA